MMRVSNDTIFFDIDMEMQKLNVLKNVYYIFIEYVIKKIVETI